MVRVRRWMVGALAAVALVAAAGCGGDGEQADAYVDELNAAQRAFTAEVRRLEAIDDDEAALAAYTAAAEEAARAIAAIDPPEDVAALHGRLVGGFDAFARQTARAERDVTSGDLDRVIAAQERMTEAAATQERLIHQTVAAINDELQTG